MTGRKTSACKLGKISHRDSASIQRVFREDNPPPKKKTPALVTPDFVLIQILPFNRAVFF